MKFSLFLPKGRKNKGFGSCAVREPTPQHSNWNADRGDEARSPPIEPLCVPHQSGPSFTIEFRENPKLCGISGNHEFPAHPPAQLGLVNNFQRTSFGPSSFVLFLWLISTSRSTAGGRARPCSPVPYPDHPGLPVKHHPLSQEKLLPSQLLFDKEDAPKADTLSKMLSLSPWLCARSWYFHPLASPAINPSISAAKAAPSAPPPNPSEVQAAECKRSGTAHPIPNAVNVPLH